MSFNIAKTSQKRIVIVGGGFGGLKLAQELHRSGFQIILIDKNNYHQFPPLIYQVASSGLEPSSISFPFRNYSTDIKTFISVWPKQGKSIPTKRCSRPLSGKSNMTT